MNPQILTNTVLEHFAFKPTEGQMAIISRLSAFIFYPDPNVIYILKGFAGTGKTTIVSSFIRALNKIKLKAVLLAPTGRAAKILCKYSGEQALTIHKKIYKLEVRKDGSIYLSLKKNNHKNTIFFIDEASMIPDAKNDNDSFFGDRNLLDDLFEYIYGGINCKAVLIGDTAQLPPVGLSISPALNIDYLKNRYSYKTANFELTEVVRQTKESGILTNATYLRQHLKNGKTFPPFFKINDFNDIHKITSTELEDLLNDSYNKYGVENCIVICRSNKIANNFNQEIRKRLLYRENEILAGDYMMVVKNNYYWLESDSEAGFIANGDLIEIIRIKKIYNIYDFRFADATIRLLDYPGQKDIEVKLMLDTIMLESPSLQYSEERRLFNEILKDHIDIKTKNKKYMKAKNDPHLNALQVKFAYSLTCHKTQGGQWDCVFIHKGYLSKDMIDTEYLRWLYTALTRATKKVLLINFPDDFFK